MITALILIGIIKAKRRGKKRKIEQVMEILTHSRYQALARCPSQIGLCDFKEYQSGSERYSGHLPSPLPLLASYSHSLSFFLWLCSLLNFDFCSKFPMSICRYPGLSAILTRLGAGLGLVNGLLVTVRMLARAVS